MAWLLHFLSGYLKHVQLLNVQYWNGIQILDTFLSDIQMVGFNFTFEWSAVQMFAQNTDLKCSKYLLRDHSVHYLYGSTIQTPDIKSGGILKITILIYFRVHQRDGVCGYWITICILFIVIVIIVAIPAHWCHVTRWVSIFWCKHSSMILLTHRNHRYLWLLY